MLTVSNFLLLLVAYISNLHYSRMCRTTQTVEEWLSLRLLFDSLYRPVSVDLLSAREAPKSKKSERYGNIFVPNFYQKKNN